MRPQYQKIKDFISEQIDGGKWAAGFRLPSENTLATQFGVSRMTATRAMRELSEDGILKRVSGVGTFVADYVPQTPLFEVKNIADEIEGRGHFYSAIVHSLTEEPANQAVATELKIPVESSVYHSLLVHYENNVAVQLEDRYVISARLPHYIEQDFRLITPNAYLTEKAPITEVEQVIEAITPDKQAQELMSITSAQPCLLVCRRTWSGTLVSSVRLIHPGNRYRMGARFETDRKPILGKSKETR